MINKKYLKAMNKKTGDDLQGYLSFKKRGSIIPPRKGKNAPYKRIKNIKDY